MALTFASASSPTSSSGSASSHIYDVFLNHRGCDVKKTFASHLYRRLCPCLRVFLDNPELQQGESLTPQIVGAIASASVHVAIFSPRYAESRWCLDELVLMLESKKKCGATIIPVFFDVKPSVLRWTDKGKDNDQVYAESLRILWQTGRYRVFVLALRILRWRGKYSVYVQALRKLWGTGKDSVYAKDLLNHEKKGRYDQKTLAAWRKALKEVSNISGFELESYNGDQGELLEKVAQRVLKTVRRPPLHVARHPTGLDKKLEEFEEVLLKQEHSGQPKFVGIVGLGGIGKTTMTKEFFNRKKSDYHRSCFLPEVREAAARGRLTSLQSRLYEVLTGNSEEMYSVDEGTGMLRRPLSCSEALIIFDDIDQVEQLLAFFSPGKDVLPSGSLIIATSRNREAFAISGIGMSSIYKMAGLDKADSQVLFGLHAFDQPRPVAGFEEVVGKFLNVCDGLPLSLKVFGAQLHGKEMEYWQALLRKVFKSKLPKDILSTLKISYDSLEEEEKKIFVDSACFFIGINRDTAITVFDGSGWEGSLGLRNLEYRCLVEIDDQNCIRMHDHLRDLGRDLADKDPLGCGRRLWCTTDLFRNLSPQSSAQVRGISLVQQRYGESFQIPSDFNNRIADISGLQLLIAPGDCSESLFKVISHPDLLWLRCEISCPLPSWVQINNLHSSLSSWIPIRNLRVLELLEDADYRHLAVPQPIPILGALWNAESEAPLLLRELNIGVDLLKLPKSIGQLKYLERIELRYFKGTLPEEFFQLRSLKHLRLKAEKMMLLPDSLGKITSLQHIDLSWCEGLQTLPPSFGNLTKLQHIDLSGCESLQTLPLSLGNLHELQHINLSYCIQLQTLPPSFGGLTKLQHLELDGCHNLTLSAETLGSISALERLAFSECHKIDVMPLQVTCQQYLEKLILDGTGLKELPSGIGDLSNLKILSLSGTSLETLPHSLGNLTNLNELRLERGKLKYLPDSVCLLRQLTSMSITFSPIPEVPFASVEKVPGMAKLKFLDLSGTRIKKISFGEGVCPLLQSLNLSGCYDLVEVGALPTTLTTLGLSYCRALKKITGLRGLAKLQSLKMEACKEIEELPGLGVRELNNLEVLYLTGCPISVVSFAFASVINFEVGLGSLDFSTEKCMPRLQFLDLSYTRITKISFGEGVCPFLSCLYLDMCQDLEEVGPLPTTLISLFLDHCCALKKITFCGLAKLRVLHMCGPLKIEELAGLDFRELINITKLNLWKSQIIAVTNVLPFVSGEKVQEGRRLSNSSIDKCMFELTSLNPSKTRITEISFGEGVFPVLETLSLKGCHDLVEVGALPTTLASVDLSDCGALKKITGLRGLAKLLELDMSGCKEIEELPGLGVGELNSLTSLNLAECPISVVPFANVEKVQGGLRLYPSIDKSMLRLRSLNLSKTRITEISFGAGVCPVLESLVLAGCDDLEEVGALPRTLTSLKLMGCVALKKITGLRGLAKLGSLDMSGCKVIEELPGLGVRELNSLHSLNLEECPISVVPFASVEKVQGGLRLVDPSIDKSMLRLTSLNLSKMNITLSKMNITEISFGAGVCPVLQSLDLASCDDLVEVGALPTTVTSVNLSDCGALKKITGLRCLAQLVLCS